MPAAVTRYLCDNDNPQISRCSTSNQRMFIIIASTPPVPPTHQSSASATFCTQDLTSLSNYCANSVNHYFDVWSGQTRSTLDVLSDRKLYTALNLQNRVLQSISIHTSVHSNVRPALSYFQRTILEPLSLPLPRPHLQVTVLLSCRALFVCRDLVVFRGLLFLPPPDALAGRFSQSQTLTHGNEGMEPSYYLISRDSCAKPRSQGNF